MWADRVAGAEQGTEIRQVRIINRCRYRDDDDIGISNGGCFRGDFKFSRGAQLFGRCFAGRVNVFAVGRYLLCGDVLADRAEVFAKLHRKRQARIPQPDGCNDLLRQVILPIQRCLF